jgi:hypothetical protein
MSIEDDPIEITVLGRTFEAPATRTAKGSPFWNFPIAGALSGRGVELDAPGESFPTVLTVNGRDHKFGRVPKNSGSSVSGQTTRFKPFTKAREVRTETHIGSHLLEIHSRVTLRRNGKWYFWFRAEQAGQNQQQPDRAARATESAWDKLKRIFPAE